jgi:hypothetical protein
VNELPKRAIDAEIARDWFKTQMGFDVPAPSADMDVRDPAQEALVVARGEATRVSEATIDPEHRWARFVAPELTSRVLDPKAIVAAQQSWRNPMVVLVGHSGAGKTSLAVAMMRVWVETNARAAAFFHAILLGAASIRHPAGHGEPELVAQAKRVPLAVLDDLGSERDTTTNDIPEIVLVRHAQRLPTFVTTGLSRAQLSTRYGAGIARRLTERATIIRCGERTKPPSTHSASTPGVNAESGVGVKGDMR